jgi:altronate dehydratase large subunit
MQRVVPGSDTATFDGFRRPDGAVGVRNAVLILGINGLVARAAERIAQRRP